uniref:Uncharacterized protein n=1 Tax=Leersia perrieri TaxID=77586 RepID=A0A0D9WH61_9ORYZ
MMGHEVVVAERRRRRRLAVDEHAELIRDGGGGGGRVRGGEDGRWRRRWVVAVVFVGEVDSGDVVDAGSALVLAAGVEPDEVLLRVAGHLRRRPARHEVSRDVPPVPSPVLLQPHQEQPVPNKTNSPSIRPPIPSKFKIGFLAGGLLVLLLCPRHALLALLVRAARAALAAADDVAGALERQAGGVVGAVPVESET